jgi:DNA-binding GntR family transcriptional regulator
VLTSAQDLGPGVSGTLHERVRDWLRDAILSGRFEPGSRIVQTDIATMLNVSPTPVREAMRDLHAEGILTLHPRRGGTVRSLDVAEIREMRMLCDVLEPMCARLVAQRITPEELEHASRLQASMEAVSDYAEYFRLNRDFHSFLYDCAESSRLASILRGIHDSTPSYLPTTFARKQARHREGLDEHRRFLRACAERDADAAADIMRLHWTPVFDEVEQAALEAPASTS